MEPTNLIEKDAVSQETSADAETPTDTEELSWDASEFIHQQKQPWWFVTVIAAGLLLIGAAAVYKEWFTAGTFLCMTVAVIMYANKQPRILQYRITGKGIAAGEKLYPYNQFRSFSIVNDVGWHAIDLDSVQRFMPRLTILFENKDLEQIISQLSRHLPKVDREPDWIDSWTRKLKL